MKVAVHDKATKARVIRRENAKPHQFCANCGKEEPYLYICDYMNLCRECAKDWRRLYEP